MPALLITAAMLHGLIHSWKRVLQLGLNWYARQLTESTGVGTPVGSTPSGTSARQTSRDLSVSCELFVQTERQARNRISSCKASVQDVLQILDVMAAMDSGQHSALAASLNRWFRKQLPTGELQKVNENFRLRSSAAEKPQHSAGTGTSNAGGAVASAGADNGASEKCVTSAAAVTTDFITAPLPEAPAAHDQRGQAASWQGSHGAGQEPSAVAAVDTPATPAAGEATAADCNWKDMQPGGMELNGDCPHTMDAGMKDEASDGLACYGFHEDKDVDSFDAMSNLDVPLDDLELKMDVRDLWAGGDSLEAWSDYTVSNSMSIVDSESVTGAVLECFKDPIWSVLDPPDELPSVFPLADEDGELGTLPTALDDHTAAPPVAEFNTGAIAAPPILPQLRCDDDFDFMFEPLKLPDDLGAGADMPGYTSDPDYMPTKPKSTQGALPPAFSAMAVPAALVGGPGESTELLCPCLSPAIPFVLATCGVPTSWMID